MNVFIISGLKVLPRLPALPGPLCPRAAPSPVTGARVPAFLVGVRPARAWTMALTSQHSGIVNQLPESARQVIAWDSPEAGPGRQVLFPQNGRRRMPQEKRGEVANKTSRRLLTLHPLWVGV